MLKKLTINKKPMSMMKTKKENMTQLVPEWFPTQREFNALKSMCEKMMEYIKLQDPTKDLYDILKEAKATKRIVEDKDTDDDEVEEVANIVCLKVNIQRNMRSCSI